MTILETIIRSKSIEVAERKKLVKTSDLEKSPVFSTEHIFF